MNLLEVMSLSEEEAIEKWEATLWPSGPVCPHCGSSNVARLKGKSTRPGTCKCRECHKKFGVWTNTFLHGSHVSMKAWLAAMHLFASKKGLSSVALAENLGVTQKTAYFMLHRLRQACLSAPTKKLEGIVEADEVYVGGKTRMGKRGLASERKVPVMTMVERTQKAKPSPCTAVTPAVGTGQVVLRMIENNRKVTLHGNLKEHVDRSAYIMTDDLRGYRGVDQYFAGHGVVRHSKKEYATEDGRHNNTAESIHARLRRMYRGIYHWWSKEHFARYLSEIEFRWNMRNLTQAQRREKLISFAPGTRITYAELKKNSDRRKKQDE